MVYDRPGRYLPGSPGGTRERAAKGAVAAWRGDSDGMSTSPCDRQPQREIACRRLPRLPQLRSAGRLRCRRPRRRRPTRAGDRGLTGSAPNRRTTPGGGWGPRVKTAGRRRRADEEDQEGQGRRTLPNRRTTESPLCDDRAKFCAKILTRSRRRIRPDLVRGPPHRGRRGGAAYTTSQ